MRQLNVSRFAFHLVLILTLCFLVSALQVAQASTTGRNVNLVEFGDASSSLGTFRQIGKTQWIEQDKQGQKTFSFSQTQRDDWSVYLLDSSRNVRLQLDLHRKMVRYSDPQTPIRDQYKILSSSSKLSGWLVSSVVFKEGGAERGEYSQQAGKAWQELSLPSRKVAFNFQEQARDDWSVYLYDASRDVHIQLDLHTRKVMYSDGSGQRRPLYTISKAR